MLFLLHKRIAASCSEAEPCNGVCSAASGSAGWGGLGAHRGTRSGCFFAEMGKKEPVAYRMERGITRGAMQQRHVPVYQRKDRPRRCALWQRRAFSQEGRQRDSDCDVSPPCLAMHPLATLASPHCQDKPAVACLADQPCISSFRKWHHIDCVFQEMATNAIKLYGRCVELLTHSTGHPT